MMVQQKMNDSVADWYLVFFFYSYESSLKSWGSFTVKRLVKPFIRGKKWV